MNTILSESCKRRVLTDKSYSVRRAYVDSFFMSNVSIIPPGGKILDIGGKKKNKRGFFNIEEYDFKVEYANIDESTDPDYICDVSTLPMASNRYDAVILSEVVEHLREPREALAEAYRVLKPGGRLLICTPFLFRVHADPYDFARYTDYWFDSTLKSIGFKNLQIKSQGSFFSVLADMLKLFSISRRNFIKENRIKLFIWDRLLIKISNKLINKLICADNSESLFIQSNVKFKGYMTGFAVICEK